MFFRRNNSGLPMASTSYSGPDGSGKAVHMDAPIVRAWKNADRATKFSYYSVLASLCMLYFGYRSIRYNHASIWLSCYAQECTLDITPSGRIGTTSITFPRKQLVKAQPVKVDGNGKFVRVDASPVSAFDYTSNRKGKKGRKKDTKGPDADGNYDSYTIHLRNRKGEGTGNFVDLSSIQDYVYESSQGDKVVLMRQFNLGQTKRRTRTMVTKIESYIRERRHKLTLKENSSLSWKGILALVLGLFLFLFTILLGQFWEEPKTHRLRGPGARKQGQQTRKKTATYSSSQKSSRASNTAPGAPTGTMRYRQAAGVRGQMY